LIIPLNQQRILLSFAAITILLAGTFPASSFAFENDDEIEIKVYVRDGFSVIYIATDFDYLEYDLDTDNETDILLSIMDQTNLDEDKIRDVWRFVVEDDERDYKHDDSYGYDGTYYDDDNREHEYDKYREHDDAKYDKYREHDDAKYDKYREHDDAKYDKYREHDLRPEDCMVDETRDVVVVEEDCIFKVFDEIPKQDCAIEFEDGLIWYEKDCVFEDDRVRYDEPRYDELRYDEPRYYEDEELTQRIHELEQENKHLKDSITDLEQQIKDLNQIVREQLGIIYDWIVSR